MFGRTQDPRLSDKSRMARGGLRFVTHLRLPVRTAGQDECYFLSGAEQMVLIMSHRMLTRLAGPLLHVRPPWTEVWLCLLLTCSAVNAEPSAITAKVVGVSDGDSITILALATNQEHEVRISSIVAPEKGQPFGQRAKEHLRHSDVPPVFHNKLNVE